MATSGEQQFVAAYKRLMTVISQQRNSLQGAITQQIATMQQTRMRPLRLQRWMRVRSHALMTLLMSLGWCVVCLDFVEVMARLQQETMTKAEGTWQLAMAIVMFAGMAMSPLFLIRAVWNCFEQPRKRGIQTVAASYLAMTIAFAGGYYVMQFWSDLIYCSDYHAHVVFSGAHPRPPKPPQTDGHALRGIPAHIFTLKQAFIDLAEKQEEQMRNGSPDETVRETIRTKYINLRDAMDYNPSARQSVFIDCLHFSVITITTVGFGDISPVTSLAKLVTDVEVLSGTAVFGLAIGIILNKRK